MIWGAFTKEKVEKQTLILKNSWYLHPLVQQGWVGAVQHELLRQNDLKEMSFLSKLDYIALHNSSWKFRIVAICCRCLKIVLIKI